jgi:ketosteroid isomerase-like protein
MDGGEAAERALRPEDLDRLFLERANAGDVDGVVDLYEPGAVLVVPPGRLAVGPRPSARYTRACWQHGRPSPA